LEIAIHSLFSHIYCLAEDYKCNSRCQKSVLTSGGRYRKHWERLIHINIWNKASERVVLNDDTTPSWT
ncbi:hypothetical protein L9F63_016510, partial [Diploptera punctata]